MQDYSELEKKIGITFDNKDLLTQAFTHKSYINEHRGEGLKDNERMEFLGDAILELVSTQHLYHNYPEQAEGEMTSFRSALVKGKHLARISKELNLGKYLFLSNGEEVSGGREKNYILANTMESFIGAIYLDQGQKAAEDFIKKFILTKLDEIIEQGLYIDAKSQFQEQAQEKEDTTPTYKLIEEIGPDHNKEFTMGAYLNDTLIATGKGSSKQNAEDKAAQKALKAKGWDE